MTAYAQETMTSSLSVVTCAVGGLAACCVRSRDTAAAGGPRVRKRHVVVLSEEERARLHTLIGRGVGGPPDHRRPHPHAVRRCRSGRRVAPQGARAPVPPHPGRGAGGPPGRAGVQRSGTVSATLILGIQPPATTAAPRLLMITRKACRIVLLTDQNAAGQRLVIAHDRPDSTAAAAPGPARANGRVARPGATLRGPRGPAWGRVGGVGRRGAVPFMADCRAASSRSHT